MRTPIATWNPAQGIWETPQRSMLCGHLVPYSETWPTSGSMRNGRLYPPPMWALPTEGNGSSSSPGLLPTTTASMAAAPAPWKPGLAWWLQSRAARSLAAIDNLLPTPVGSERDRTPEEAELRHLPGRAMGRNGGGSPDLSSVVALLPTPMTVNRTSERAQTGRPTSGPQRGGPSYGLEDVVLTRLLPTPQARDSQGPPGEAARERGGFQASLPASIKELLPTPLGRDSKGRDSTTRLGPPSLPQLLWDGGFTHRPSRGGKGFSDVPLPLQWNQDGSPDGTG